MCLPLDILALSLDKARWVQLKGKTLKVPKYVFLYSKAFDSILKVIRGQIEEKKSEKEQNMTGSQSMSYDGKYMYTN